MHNQKSPPRITLRWLASHWLVMSVVALAVVVALSALLAGQPVAAAPATTLINQTVPPPTPRPTPQPADNDDNDDENNNSGDNSANQGDSPTPVPADAAAAAAEATPATEGASGLTAVVQAVTLNVRQGPGTTFPVVGKLTQDTVVGVLGRNEAGDWWSICCLPESTTGGWVSAEFLAPNFAADQASSLPVLEAPEAAATPAPVATADTAAPAPSGGVPGTVTALTLNVRGGPSTDDDVIGKIRQDQQVSVLGRNTGGDWLYICCLGGAQPNGWVSAQFITPTFALADLAEVPADAAAAPVATPEPAATAEATPEAEVTPAAEATEVAEEAEAGAGAAEAGQALLEVRIEQRPPFAVQGNEIALILTIANTGDVTATNVVLRSELPAVLSLIDASASTGGEVSQEASAEGAGVVTVTWPELPPGLTSTANVRVTVAADAPNGAVYDNLAAVEADNAPATSAGIIIGMPPSMLPEFW